MKKKGRVTGIGGIFFKTNKPEQIKSWYHEHLGLTTDQYGTSFEWREKGSKNKGFTQWSPFTADTNYFSPSEKEFMINYRVEHIEALIEQLKEDGVTVLDEIETFDYGKFVHILDPDNNKIELWEPVDEEYDKIAEAITSK